MAHLNFTAIYYSVLKAKVLKEEQFKVLKTLSEATSRMDLNMFAQSVGLTTNQAIAAVQELAREGFLQKVGNGFGLTEKGRNAVKIHSNVSSELAFNFYVGIDKPLGISAASLAEFYRQVKLVCSDSLEFHLNRGDFERWLTDVVKDAELVQAISNLKSAELKGEELRRAMLNAIDAKYGVDELL